MTIKSCVRSAVMVLLSCLLMPAHAQDTDLFMTNNPEANALLPNVLIVLDNTANWSSSSGDPDFPAKFDLAREALSAVVSGLDEDLFNVGLMLFSEDSNNVSPSGGYVRFAIRTMTPGNKETLSDLVSGLINDSHAKGGDRGNNAEYALAMHEAYLYFSGLNSRSGFNKSRRDEGAFEVNPKYLKPAADACVKNYVIFISNGAPDNGENTTAGNLLAGLSANTSVIPLNPSTRQANWSDEYARFMSASGINTYTFEINPVSSGQGPALTALLKSMAQQGDGEYSPVSTADELTEKLGATFKKIQSVNSVFASTALPVSVNVRGTFLNEVYMGVFRPDEDAGPRWDGNLKLFQFAVDESTDTLYLADASTPPEPAQSPVTGFIRNTAKSFWTTASTYWNFSPRGEPESGSDSPDGNIVEKGGAAQQHRAVAPSRRKLYTCAAGGCGNSGTLLSTNEFNIANDDLTAATFGVADAEREDLINWVRGDDVDAERNVDGVKVSDGQGRPSLHGDVVHSRPAVVNFNRGGGDNDIVVFYGANDGVFRAVKGGKTVTGAGSELWGFVAPEFFGKISRLRSNSPAVNVPSNPSDPDGNKPYFADGNVSVYTIDNNGDGQIVATAGDKAYLFVTMRRGGRFVYAFDVSVPEAPRFLWTKGCSATGACDAGYAELGQTWSEAKVRTINLNGTSTPVLIMGAGYDPASDDLNPAGTAVMGRGIMVVNALTGAMIWQAGPDPKDGDFRLKVDTMTHSIPADVTALDVSRNGFADRVYAVDTGANVWRADISSPDPGNWTVSRLAALGGSGADARKFLYPVDAVTSEDANGEFMALLLGSGDREHPFDETVVNHFYMLKDRDLSETIVLSDLYDTTDNLIQEGTEEQIAAANASLLSSKGWYFVLADGEKVVGNAITLGGSVFFATNQPAAVTPNSCASNLGVARAYVVSYENGAAVYDFNTVESLTSEDRFTEVPGGGFPPSPTGVVVEVDGKKYETVCFGPTCIPPEKIKLEARSKVYWYKSGVD